MLKVAFYKGKGTWIDWGIRTWTRSKYSHCELIIPEGRGFAASTRDKGTRIKDGINWDSGRWDVIDLGIEEVSGIIAHCERLAAANKGYAYWDIARFVLPFLKTDKKRGFCSEVVATVLRFPKPQNISPGDLYRRLT